MQHNLILTCSHILGLDSPFNSIPSDPGIVVILTIFFSF